MDSIPLVDAQKIDGERLRDQLVQNGFEVTAACWAKPVNEDRWSLYIASPVVDRLGPPGAYREAYRLLRTLGQSWVSPSDVKLIGERHPIAQHAASLARGYPGPTHSRAPLLGDIFVDEAYIYPLGPGASVV